jgi:hypothetical protein
VSSPSIYFAVAERYKGEQGPDHVSYRRSLLIAELTINKRMIPILAMNRDKAIWGPDAMEFMCVDALGLHSP